MLVSSLDLSNDQWLGKAVLDGNSGQLSSLYSVTSFIFAIHTHTFKFKYKTHFKTNCFDSPMFQIIALIFNAFITEHRETDM